MLTAATFVLLYLVGCLMALARHPIYGLMTYVVVFYVSPSDRWWGRTALAGSRWALIAAVVTMVALVIHRTKPPQVPFLRQPLVIGMLVFVTWLGIQSFWALDPVSHQSLATYYPKFVVAMYLIYRCVDSTENIKRFLWAHVLGCTYLGWIVYTTHTGGRFDDFGGAGIGDGNAGALACVTGALSAGALFLSSSYRAKLVLVAATALIVNAVVATTSRSAFLALVAGGVAFNYFAPPHFRRWVLGLSIVGLAGFLFLTNAEYWGRIESLQYRGEQVEGVDTGYKRLVLAQAQLNMSREYPLGCGSRCTDVLSPQFLPETQLDSQGRRSSHNTFLTMLVEQGIPGALLYVGMVLWVLASLRSVARSQATSAESAAATLFPAVAGSLVAIIVGDLFVQYPKFEIRFWFLTLGMVLLGMVTARSGASESASTAATHPADPAVDGAGVKQI
jgi:O-Antigen ligase